MLAISALAKGTGFLLGAAPADAVGSQTFWLGGRLTTPADGCHKSGTHCSGAYAFSGPVMSVPAVALLSPSADTGILMSLDLDYFLSTQLSLSTNVSSSSLGLSFGYQQYRLGAGSAPLVLTMDIVAIAADPRAALGAVVARHPTYFNPAVPAANTLTSGTGWYM